MKTAAVAWSSEANAPVATTILPPPSKDSTSTMKSTGESAPSSAEQIIDSIKAALARPDTRRTYGTLSKLAESVDEKNVREVLAFAQNLPRQQDKNTLVSLLALLPGTFPFPIRKRPRNGLNPLVATLSAMLSLNPLSLIGSRPIRTLRRLGS